MTNILKRSSTLHKEENSLKYFSIWQRKGIARRSSFLCLTRIRAHKSAIMYKEIQYLGLVYFTRCLTEDRRGIAQLM